MHNRFRKDTDLLLSGLTWTREDTQRVLAATKGEPIPVKKKLGLSFALAACLLLVTTAVALAIGLTHSRQYDQMLAARAALMNRYSLTQEMISLFDTQTEEAENGAAITFTASASSFARPDAIGRYTAVVDQQGGVTVSWSHDDADPAAWADADLTSSVWGAPQLQQMLDRYALYTQWWEEHDRADVYSLPAEERDPLFDELRAAVAPLVLTEIPDGEPKQPITPAATPVVAVSDAEAAQAARQALYTNYGLTDAMLGLFTQVQSLDMLDGAPVRTVVYLPVSAETANAAENADWRWVHLLEEKLGTYRVTLNAQTNAVVSVSWSLDGVAVAEPADGAWADAAAYTADILPDVLDFLQTNEAIIVKYPEDQVEWFSVEDAAAYDQAFRDAGFDPAAYRHGLPKDTDISAQQAKEIAREAMADAYALTGEQLDDFQITVEYVLDGGGAWWIGFYGSEGMGAVTLNAATGEVQMVTLLSAATSNG